MTLATKPRCRAVGAVTAAPGATPSGPPLTGAGDSAHVVQFYETDACLVESIAQFLTPALRGSNAVFVAATPEHREALEARLQDLGFDLDQLRTSDRYLSVDAATALGRCAVDGLPNKERFLDFMAPLIRRATANGRRVRAFGEIVALLCQQGKMEDAVTLEAFWNDLIDASAMSLLCAYPMSRFRGTQNGPAFQHICQAHRRVIPVETFATDADEDTRHRALALLQQQAGSLELEILERQRAEAEVRAQQARAAELLERTIADRTAELEATVGELEAFSYSISHDLRAPLRWMQGYAKLLMNRCGDELTDECRGYLRGIANAGVRMDRLIQDVLAFSQVPRSAVQLEPVCLDALLRGVVESHPELQPPHAQVSLDSPFPVVRAHRAALSQCLANLLGNAVKFVAAGVAPCVRIWVESPPLIDQAAEILEHGSPTPHRMIRLCIQDNGIGIPPEGHERVFGIFQRLSSDHEGTGIGLAIVKKTAERMGGRVGLSSDPGRGSTFWLELVEA